MIKWLWIFLLALPSLTLAGQSNSAAFRREFLILTSARVTLTLTDIEVSQWRMRQSLTWHEYNPMLPHRPGRKRMMAQFLAGDTLCAYVSWRFYKNGHRNVSRIIQISNIAISSYCIIHNISRR